MHASAALFICNHLLEFISVARTSAIWWSCAVGSTWRQYQAVLSGASVAVPEAARFCRAANFFRSPNQIIVPQRTHIFAVVLMKLSLRVQNLVLPGVK